MKRNQLKNKLFIFFIFYIIAPIGLVEIFSQFRYSYGYFFEILSGRKTSEKVGLRPSNANYSKAIKTLYGDTSKIKIIKYRTDKYGTIHPSTISNAKNKIDKSTLFCGGSTTETSVVQEGQRIPDIYSKITSKIAINASRSGKDLKGCIETIDYFIKYHGKPKNIIIATNLNTIGLYGRLQGDKKIESKNFFSLKDPESGLRNFVRKSFKSLTPGLAKTRMHIKKQEDLELQASGEINYESRLFKGCCFISGTFNKPGSNIVFDWESSLQQEGYRNLIRNQLKRLDILIKKYSIDKQNIFFFLEPNSFLLSGTSSKTDLRQYLHDKNGFKVDGINSAKWTKIYDDIYLNTVKQYGYKVLNVKISDLRSQYFYDAVHLTPEGSKFIGKFYSDKIVPSLNSLKP